jgi:hypothetical protein
VIQLAALRVAAVVAVLLLAAGGGAVVNGWRLSAAHAESLRVCASNVQALQISIEQQNAAVAQLRTAADAANTARQRAEQEAVAHRRAAKVRDDWISKLQGTCDENLRDSWGRM